MYWKYSMNTKINNGGYVGIFFSVPLLLSSFLLFHGIISSRFPSKPILVFFRSFRNNRYGTNKCTIIKACSWFNNISSKYHGVVTNSNSPKIDLSNCMKACIQKLHTIGKKMFPPIDVRSGSSGSIVNGEFISILPPNFFEITYFETIVPIVGLILVW